MTDSKQDEILNIFKETGALMTGHFILRSGLHSGHYFQCARACEYMNRVEQLAKLLLDKLTSLNFETVVSPAMGGLVIGQEVARRAGKRFIFVEKVADILTLRRGFVMNLGEKILVVEDVFTRGCRIRETLEIIKTQGADPIGIAVLVDRSEGKTKFEVPVIPLLKLSFPTYEADKLPDGLKKITPYKPGS